MLCQYKLRKLAKYGIKIFTFCNKINLYTRNLEICAGIRNCRCPVKVYNGTASVVKWVNSIIISKTHRNVTTDN